MSEDSADDKKIRRNDRILLGVLAALFLFVVVPVWLVIQSVTYRPKHDSAAAARQFEAFHRQFPHVRNMRESDLVGQSLEGAAAPPPRGPIAVQYSSIRADHHGEMLAIRYCVQDGGCGLATVRTANNEVGLLRAPDGMQVTAYTLSRDGASLFAAITCCTNCNPPYEPNFIVEVDVATRRIVWAKPLHRLEVTDLVVDDSKSKFVMATATSSYNSTFGASTMFQRLVAYQREGGTEGDLRELETLAPAPNVRLFRDFRHLHWCADGRVVAIAQPARPNVTPSDLMREAGANELWAEHKRTWDGRFGFVIDASKNFGAQVIPSMRQLAKLDSWDGVGVVAADSGCNILIATIKQVNASWLTFRMDRGTASQINGAFLPIRAMSGDGLSLFGSRTMASSRVLGGPRDPVQIVRIVPDKGDLTLTPSLIVIPVREVIEREVIKRRTRSHQAAVVNRPGIVGGSNS